MKIVVKSKPNAKVEKVERVSQPDLGFGDEKTELVEYVVAVKELPIHGQANEAIIKALANYFDVPKTLIKLVSGQTSKRKVFEIYE